MTFTFGTGSIAIITATAVLAVIAVGAVGVEASRVLFRCLGLPPERLDVGERVGELLRGCLLYTSPSPRD